jgi:hypothetical protein
MARVDSLPYSKEFVQALPGIKHSSLFSLIKMTPVKIFRIENVSELFLEPGGVFTTLITCCEYAPRALIL